MNRKEIESLEIIRGSGNVYADFGYADADLRQLKAKLATEIIKALDSAGLSVRQAHARTGFAAADFSRVRNADLNRFTVDRLLTMVNRLGSRVEVALSVQPAKRRRLASVQPSIP
jgi:predicted XRE-type DNA-binding protein